MRNNVWYYAPDGSLHKGKDLGVFTFGGYQYRKIIADDQERYVALGYTGMLKDVPNFNSGDYGFVQNKDEELKGRGVKSMTETYDIAVRDAFVKFITIENNAIDGIPKFFKAVHDIIISEKENA